MTISVTDHSEETIAEVAIGKNLITKEWCASMDFSDDPWSEDEVL